ncbi:hypothetical protein O181_040259 [Austropuccinia psidii MF-1]|uniref:sterol 3beta-glucosyltransferase n=1 Tax=Austropuccinia psidii MF-1 TaxID=1389203 RepID=A0A9Q3HFC2_9BASI|nr:hypothetical protein [Austropuccinia psidii MF-1]
MKSYPSTINNSSSLSSSNQNHLIPSQPSNQNQKTCSDSFYLHTQPGVGSTASLLGILKAAALNSIQNDNLKVIHQSPDHQNQNQINQNINLNQIFQNQIDSVLKPDLNQSPSDSFYNSNFLISSNHLNQPSNSNLNSNSLNDPNNLNQLNPSDSTSNHSNSSQTNNQSIDSIPSQSYLPNSNLLEPASPSDSLSSSSSASSSSQSISPSIIQSKSNIDFNWLKKHFDHWSGKDINNQPQDEIFIKKLPGMFALSVLIQGLIILTNRRLCFFANLPPVDMGQIIRSGSATLRRHSRFGKHQRRWIELRTDSLTEYRSSTKPFRLVSSLHFSNIKGILPISRTDSKILRLRLLDGQLVYIEFDTVEATADWYQEFIKALFSFKTHSSNQIKIMIPLPRIKKVQRSNFENMAKIMNLIIDPQSDLSEITDSDVIEQNLQSDSDPPKIELSYFLSYGPFDDLVIDAIVKSKLEIPLKSNIHGIPSPLLQVIPRQSDETLENLNDEIPTGHSSGNHGFNLDLINRFTKAFGLESTQQLPVYSCNLMRYWPIYGYLAVSKDYLCFWHRGVLSPDYKLRIPLKDLGPSKSTSAFGLNRFGLAVEVTGAPDIRLDFNSKSTREQVVKVLEIAIESFNVELKRQKNSPITSHILGSMDQLPFKTIQSKSTAACIGDVKLEKVISPSRIVCLTIGSRGDVQPYISLAKRLMQDGHTVTIASHPEYRSWVESFGILYKDVGGDPAALMNFSVEHNFFSPGFFKEGYIFFRTWLENLFVEAWEACRDSQAQILIESPSTFAGIHIAEALCIPYFRAFTMTWTSTTTYPQAFAASTSIDLGPSYNLLTYSLFDSLMWRAMSSLVNKWRKNTLNIPSTSMEKMQAYKVPFMYNFSSVVVPKPLDWRDHVDVTGYWFLDQSHGDYEPPEDMVTFIASARSDNIPLVYIGFGSVTVPDSTAVTKAIYEAVVQAGIRAIVAKGWSDRMESKTVEEISPPSQVYVIQSVPHDWLFPQVDAVCHHGGAGTTGMSLRFGKPTVIHPFFGDQTFWAERVSKLGAGIKIDSLTTPVLREAFKKATSDRIMKEKAIQVKERIQIEDGPSRAVQFIYKYLDFALERTQHRIERTKNKKYSRMSSAKTIKKSMKLVDFGYYTKKATDQKESTKVDISTETPNKKEDLEVIEASNPTSDELESVGSMGQDHQTKQVNEELSTTAEENEHLQTEHDPGSINETKKKATSCRTSLLCRIPSIQSSAKSLSKLKMNKCSPRD